MFLALQPWKDVRSAGAPGEGMQTNRASPEGGLRDRNPKTIAAPAKRTSRTKKPSVNIMDERRNS
jgi:hypothetical protein